MWASKKEVRGWIRAVLDGTDFWIMPPTDRNFQTAVIDRDPEDYRRMLDVLPEVASLSLLMAHRDGDAIAVNRWWLNMEELLSREVTAVGERARG